MSKLFKITLCVLFVAIVTSAIPVKTVRKVRETSLDLSAPNLTSKFEFLQSNLNDIKVCDCIIIYITTPNVCMHIHTNYV